MSTDIYNFDYEKELQKNSDNFAPMGSINPKTNIRSSPIVVPDESKMSNIRSSPIVVPAVVKSGTRVSSKRAEPPATITARKAMPVIFRQPYYNHFLNRPYTLDEIKSINKSKYDPDIEYKSNVVEYPNKEGWDFYNEEFYGGKKRSRKARTTRRKRSRKTRSKRIKRSSSRRYRGRKGR